MHHDDTMLSAAFGHDEHIQSSAGRENELLRDCGLIVSTLALLLVTGCQAPGSVERNERAQMTGHVVEIATFSAKRGVTEQALLKAAVRSDRFVAAQPGFVSRRFVRREDGRWIDIIEWQSAQAARMAADKFATAAQVHDFMATIGDDAQLQHLPLLHSR